MSEFVSTTVDVRDMLCAQALARVAQAVACLRSGQALQARYNAEDVRQDLLYWARERGYAADDLAEHALILIRR